MQAEEVDLPRSADPQGPDGTQRHRFLSSVVQATIGLGIQKQDEAVVVLVEDLRGDQDALARAGADVPVGVDVRSGCVGTHQVTGIDMMSGSGEPGRPVSSEAGTARRRSGMRRNSVP